MAAVRRMIRDLSDMHIRLGEISRAGSSFDFQPDEKSRADMAATLALVAITEFQTTLTVSLWLDGAEIEGTWKGVVTQTCGVSLDDFDTPLAGHFKVHIVPSGSPNAPALDSEVDLDPDATDPPDVLDSDVIDLGAYVVEHLGLEVDPFPRKPGAVFEPPETTAIISPFASLKALKP